MSTSPRHSIRVAFPDGPWESVQSIPVDREGEYIFSLWKRRDDQGAKKVLETSRLLCEVRVMDNVKVVTIRSTYRVENRTLYPLELALADEGPFSFSMEKIGEYAAIQGIEASQRCLLQCLVMTTRCQLNL